MYLHSEAPNEKIKFIYNDYHIKSTNPGVFKFFNFNIS